MLLGINLFDYATETTEWTICYLNSFINCVWHINAFFNFGFFSCT